ncbi:MAG: YbcC family protein [Rhodospirillaceae bacterium]
MFANVAEDIRAAVERAGRQIPPSWPLAAAVAVNPFLGQCRESLAGVGARLGRITSAAVTLPRRWYREKIAAGAITDADLEAALSHAPSDLRPADIGALKKALAEDEPPAQPLPTVADLAAQVSGVDWPGIVAERISAWAGSYFDEGQAMWSGAKGPSAFAAWGAYASHDLSPEILGLRGFANHVEATAAVTLDAITQGAGRLGLTENAMDSYFHQLLLTLGGWSQFARYKLWQAELKGGEDTTLADLLAVRLVWEVALFERYRGQIAARWQATVAAHADPLAPTPALIVNIILQDALERASQRALALTLSQPAARKPQTRAKLQAAFCIDVRSEVFRRALESLSPEIQTLGFAGFFGMPVAHRRFASDTEELRLPVLLNPAQLTCAGGDGLAPLDRATRFKRRAKRAWGRFKLAAVSSFAFVEAAGPLYAAKLLVDGLALRDNTPANDPAPRHNVALDRAARSKTAASILRAMSFTEGFGRLVLLAGHGAHVVNNPHASALQCGACGGYKGDVNARMLAALLNDPETRQDLAGLGIAIPKDTLFLAALHDTTTDRVTLYLEDQETSTHAADIAQAVGWLDSAGDLARQERALRLPRAGCADLQRRGRDWAQTRPEWALAGCSAFIAAPRARTAGKSLEGRAFLHDYEWRQDPGFGTLTLILTAPVVVASWISLQYYGSAVAPQLFGAGNKLLHNVVGGLGVFEGNGGPLRAGLPWQSVHDGARYVHEPLRLSVCVEAPREAISDVLNQHPDVRALFDNGWLHLFALDDQGQMAWRYRSGGGWCTVSLSRAAVPIRPLNSTEL